MTCRELLQNPVYCRVTDSPERALDIMNITELPAIPVVTDHHSRKFQGLVHAAAIRAAQVAGQLPALVGPLVQPAELLAHPDDNYAVLSGEMAQRGLASLPMVDEAGRLVGIVTPGAELTGRLHEPTPPPGRTLPAGVLIAGATLAGVAAGAGLMYLLDPKRGAARRTRLLSRSTKLLHRAGHAIEAWEHDLANRAMGATARAERLLHREAVPDEKLQARVRSALGHLLAHPRQVAVEVKNGNVAMSSTLRPEELARLESGVAKVPGVHAVAVAGPPL
jgi:CBS domain